MRVITGTARGTRLVTPPAASDIAITRPTPERVKEAVFSILQFDIEGRRTLDLFAGTGQLGLEALSRGASFCDFVDNSPEAIDIIKRNIALTRFTDRTSVSSGDYKVFIGGIEKRRATPYALIFLDPPYALGAIPAAIALLDSSGLIDRGGLVVCESGEELNIERTGFAALKQNRYGTVRVAIFEKQ